MLRYEGVVQTLFFPAIRKGGKYALKRKQTITEKMEENKRKFIVKKSQRKAAFKS